jgi:hypothetical protein
MTPRKRDRSIVRVRHLTGVMAGLSLAACGVFAGLAASATTHAQKTIVRTTTVKKTTPSVTKTVTQAAAPTVTVTQAAPVATSGGS